MSSLLFNVSAVITVLALQSTKFIQDFTILCFRKIVLKFRSFIKEKVVRGAWFDKHYMATDGVLV